MERLNRALKSGLLSLVLFLVTSCIAGIIVLTIASEMISESSFLRWILVVGFVAVGYALQRKMNLKGNDDDSHYSTLMFAIPPQIGELYTATQNIRFKLFNDFEDLHEPFERVARIIGTAVTENHANFLIDVEFDNKQCYNIIRGLLMTRRDDLEIYTSVIHGYNVEEHVLILHYRELDYPFIVKISNEGVFVARRLC